jgi:hypothetical protein
LASAGASKNISETSTAPIPAQPKPIIQNALRQPWLSISQLETIGARTWPTADPLSTAARASPRLVANTLDVPALHTVDLIISAQSAKANQSASHCAAEPLARLKPANVTPERISPQIAMPREPILSSSAPTGGPPSIWTKPNTVSPR